MQQPGYLWLNRWAEVRKRSHLFVTHQFYISNNKSNYLLLGRQMGSNANKGQAKSQYKKVKTENTLKQNVLITRWKLKKMITENTINGKWQRVKKKFNG